MVKLPILHQKTIAKAVMWLCVGLCVDAAGRKSWGKTHVRQWKWV